MTTRYRRTAPKIGRRATQSNADIPFSAPVAPHAPGASALLLALLLALAACLPAAPAAPAPTATPVTPPSPAATLTPKPSSTPTATPTPRPQPSLLVDDTFTPAEQAALQARLDDPPAAWGYDPATTDVQAGRDAAGRIYLTLSHKPASEGADPQPLGRIIVLESLTGPAIAFADLADAQAAAEAGGLAAVSYIWVDYENQVVGADANGQAVVIFDLAANGWGPVTPPTPEPTATPDAAEALRQHPWEVQYTAGGSGELTAQYYNAKSKEIVSVVAPEIENLQKSIWEAPDGRQLIIYQDTANAYGLAKYRYPYNPEAKQFFPEGTIAWLEPKLLVNYPDGQAVRGGIVMVPEFQAQRQAQVPAAEKLQGKWRIGLPFTQKPSETLASEMALGPWNGYNYILKVNFNPDNGVVVVNPITGKNLTTSYSTNPTDHLVAISVENIAGSGFLPTTDAEKMFAVRVNEKSAFNPSAIVGNQHTTNIGEVLVYQINGVVQTHDIIRNMTLSVVGPNGSWKSFGLQSFDDVAGHTVMTAPSAN